MDAFLKKVRQLSTIEGPKVELLKFMANQESTLRMNPESLLTMAVNLTMPGHTIPLIFIINARLEQFQSIRHENWGEWLGIALKFLATFNQEDAQLDPKRMYRVAHIVSHYTTILSTQMSHGMLNSLIGGLINVVECLARPLELTPLHSEIVKLALMTHRPHLAVPFISQVYCTVDKKVTGITANQVILYFYYAGSIWLSLKNYEKAADHFVSCISTPCIAIHAASVEAFKKLILVKLISEGVAVSVPKLASGILQRFLRQVTDVYSELASVYTRKSPKSLKAFIEKYSADFLKDQNHGLIKQLVKARTRRLVQHLTNSYTTVSLHDIAQQSATETREVEQILLQMIEEGDLDARIDQEHGIVFFEEKGVTGQYQAFETQAGQLMTLLVSADQRLKDLMLDPDYVRETLTMRDNVGAGPGLLSDLA
jgi:COP9 signalosome complex subunit 3